MLGFWDSEGRGVEVVTMNLLDGLNHCKKDTEWWDFTLEIENAAIKVVRLISARGYQRNSVTAAAPCGGC
jgi:hypothetical protein